VKQHPKQILTLFQQLGSVANLRPCFFLPWTRQTAQLKAISVDWEWTQACKENLELPQVKDDDHASQEQHDAQGQEELLSLEICFRCPRPKILATSMV